MEHLDFVDRLEKHGISVRSANFENREMEFDDLDLLGGSKKIILKNFNVRYKDNEPVFGDPLKSLIKLAIDMDTWKHSWHNEIKPENYEKFIGIIQEKILERARQIDELSSVMFLLRHEILRENKIIN